MELSQELIDEAVRVYNAVTHAHKRAPVKRYIHKQLAVGETVELSSGKQRWSSALQFAGTPEEVEITFLINPALPESFKEDLLSMREEFDAGLRQVLSA